MRTEPVRRSLYPLAVSLGLLLIPAGATPLRGQETAPDPIPLKNWVPATMHVTPPERHRSAMSQEKWMSEATDRSATSTGIREIRQESALTPQSVDQAEVAAGGTSFSYYYVPGSVLMPRDGATNIDYTGTGCAFTTSGSDLILNTQLQLPDGAEIKYLRIFYNDTNAAEDVRGYITRYDAGTATNDIISVASSGSGGVGTMLSAEICDPSPCPAPPASGRGHIVDNFGFGYVLIGWPDVSSSTVQVCGLRVAYYAPPTGTFHPIGPCRIADTRPGSGFSGNFGGPALSAGVNRTMDPRLSACGTQIPTQALAVSLNVTVTQTGGPGDLRVYPTPGPTPLVSTLNYLAGQTIANAAVVPLGTNGVNFLPAVSGTHLIVDVNGYFY